MTNIVILLITPAQLRHRHVNNLAAIARQLLCPNVRDCILKAASRQDVLDAIRQSGC